MRLIDADELKSYVIYVIRGHEEFLAVRWSEIQDRPTVDAPAVLFICDRTKCDNCHTDCSHTREITHAKNFKQDELGNFVETVPVRHGHWIYSYDESRGDFTIRRWYCSACNNWQTYGEPKYCPNCGAKMDEEASVIEEAVCER